MAASVRRGRVLVLVAFTLAAFFAIEAFALRSATPLRAFLTFAGVAFTVMVVGGFAQRLWRGAEVEEAQGSGGWGARLAQATRRPIRTLEARVDTQMTALSNRVHVLEKEVLKDQRGPSIDRSTLSRPGGDKEA